VVFNFTPTLAAADIALDFDAAPEIATLLPDTSAPVVPAGPAQPLIFDLEDVDQAPQATLRLPPRYPFQAQARGLQGYVDVRFTVSANGDIRDITSVASEPAGVFEAAAKQAVARWRFKPGRKNGQAIDTRLQVRIRFTLRQ
jgi:protein TonB